MAGLLVDSCNNVRFQGYDEFEVPTARLSPPTGGDQAASVVITGDSSEIVLQNCDIAAGAGTLAEGPFTTKLALELVRKTADKERWIPRRT